ncbi:MAG: hypothetical protein ACXVAX_02185 [Pseudobdellovibrio sp.]
MKNMLLVLFTLLSCQAFASKARILALGTPMHLVDYQFLALNPIFIHLPNAVIVESGLTTSTNVRNNAEGVVVYGIGGDARMAIAFGKNDELYENQRAFMNSIVGAGTYSTPQNMVHLVYGNKVGETTYSIGSSYSNLDDKIGGATESSAGLVGAVKNGQWLGFGSYSLVNSVETAAGNKFDGAGHLRLAGRYSDGDLMYGIDAASWMAKSSTAGVEQQSYGFHNIQARVINSTKKDGNDLFYGAGINSITLDCKTQAGAGCSTHFAKLMLPILIGFEANASEWLVVRGSITQSAVLNSTKDEIGLPAAATSGIPGATGALTDFGASTNSTVVAAGLGLKFNKVIVDGTVATATTQVVNTSNFMSQVGMTYNF